MNQTDIVALYLSSTSNHNLTTYRHLARSVALYLSSTSNHNDVRLANLHQTVALYLSSTSNHNPITTRRILRRLRYIFLLHQTTTRQLIILCGRRCVISFFYIKPQRLPRNLFNLSVALYLSSTSNHNCFAMAAKRRTVALYLSSTSNHNDNYGRIGIRFVALYLSSTSNHNRS